MSVDAAVEVPRADCKIFVQPAGETEVHVQSLVEPMYGGAIRSQILDRLAELDVVAKVHIEDSGALPFTIAARLDAAILAKFSDVKLPKFEPAIRHAPSARRTRLYVPGNTPKYFPHAHLYGADAIIFDLEDSVAEDEKDAALRLVGTYLSSGEASSCELMVRVNNGERQRIELDALAPFEGLTIILPKVESGADIPSNFPGFRYVALFETARGMFSAFEVSQHPQVEALAIGLEDYTADIGAERTSEAREAWWAYGQIVNAARAFGKQPLASSFSRIDDHEGLKGYVRQVAEFGFEGIGCIHPGQVAIVHEALRPTADQLAEAQRIVTLMEDGRGVAALDGKMIDAPVLARAKRVIRTSGVSS